MNPPDHREIERDVDRGPLNWTTVLAAALLAALELYEGLQPAWAGEMPSTPSIFLVGVLVAGIVVFFTRYWRPPLYLLGALVGLYVLVVWLLGDTTMAPLSLATAGSAALLVVLSFVSFYREQIAYLSEEPSRSPGNRRP